MTTEGNYMNGETRMAAVATEILTEREQFWAEASMADKMFCGDDGSEDGYLHAFGGLEEVVYGLQILKEATEPGSVTEPLEDTIASLAPVVKNTGGLNAGLHSDVNNEGDGHFHADKTEGGLGCAKVAKQQAISKLISDERVAIIQKSKELAPELFQGEEDDISAESIANAHGAVAERDAVFGSPRSLVAKAAGKGVEVQVLDRDHNPESAGIINFVKDTKFNSKSAMTAEVPAYTVDIWATNEAFDNMHHLYPYDKRSWGRYVIMSTVATFMALGIPENKMVARR